MAAGRVPPLAIAVASTVLARRLSTPVERQNVASARLLGATFISEGAIPFAAADPLRVIPASLLGGAGAGQGGATRPFQLVTGRNWRGSAFGGARGRTDVPKIIDWYMDGRIKIDPLITDVIPLDQINEGFHKMHEGKGIRTVVQF